MKKKHHIRGREKHGPALFFQKLFPADAECPACPLLPGAGAVCRCGLRRHEGGQAGGVVIDLGSQYQHAHRKHL